MDTSDVSEAIDRFVELYNANQIPDACMVYAEKVLYYDGQETRLMTRAEVQVDIEAAVSDLVGQAPIRITGRRIDPSIDGRKAHVQVTFTIGKNSYSAMMIYEWVDQRPQVTFDHTIAV